ncbi:MAG: response regulator [Lachnospiraceae bacterium]|nr:response regulator [Lachnospiraceae bacterium]
MEQRHEQTEKNKHINRVVYIFGATVAAIIILGIVGHFVISSYINKLLVDNEQGTVPISDVHRWMNEVLIVYYLLVSFFGLIMLGLTIFIIRNGRLVTKLEEENRAIDVAERANQAKTDFLANMSHEIRTPINSILGFNEMIARETDQDVIAGYTEDIKGSGETLLFLINDILDFSKIESGNVEISEKKYDVPALINNINNMIAIRATGKGLEYNVLIDPRVPKSLFGDKNRVQQIIVNLLTNAVKYTDSGSVTFKMGWNEEKRSLLVQVVDTGRGIKDEDVKLLFNKFQRIGVEDNGNIEGSGLGLVITKMLLNKMDGSIDFTSTYGEGSTFSVVIPQKQAGMERIGHYEKPERRRRKFSHMFHAHDAKILVVDDTVTNLAIIKGLLKDTGLIIDTAVNGEACLEMVRDNRYDIIFLDIRMPGMSGEEVLKQINERGYRRSVPIIALTADALKESRDKFLAEGFTDYLAKPVSGDSLEEMIIHFISKDKIEVISNDENNKHGEVSSEDAIGLFKHLNEYIETHNEEALKSMLGALSMYSFTPEYQGRFNIIKSAFDTRDYDRMKAVVGGILNE